MQSSVPLGISASERARWFTCAFARLSLVVLGGAAIAWGTTVFPRFWHERALEQMTASMVARVPFRNDVLRDFMGRVEAAEREQYCRPPAARAAAVFRLRTLEEAMAMGDRLAIDDDMEALRQAINRSLACAPTDSFLWMILYWLNVTQNGFYPKYLTYLRLSYQLGSHEGWIALQRNRLAFAVYQQLPPDVADDAINEFIGLVNTRLYSDTANIFIRSGRDLQQQLLSKLADVAPFYRQAFAKALYESGYDGQVLGVKPADTRPFFR
jgi:hypothetical protein